MEASESDEHGLVGWWVVWVVRGSKMDRTAALPHHHNFRMEGPGCKHVRTAVWMSRRLIYA